MVCPDCNGTGYLDVYADEYGEPVYRLCDTCESTGEIDGNPLPPKGAADGNTKI